MSNINITGTMNGGNNQFGDNNQQIIVSTQVLNEVRENLIAKIKTAAPDQCVDEYISYVEVLTDVDKPQTERKSAASKIKEIIVAVLPTLSEMAGAFLKGYTQQ